mgnify:FL=1|jgi:chromatin segregation and condensation protein Rec8/ScpA/Scc1 (kleisin family)
MGIFDGTAMKEDIVSRLMIGETDLQTSQYLDRLVELSQLEEAEHQFLIEPFDRSVALVFQMFQSSDLDPWDVDLSAFLKMFNKRIDEAENIDLPTCGRLVRMAWAILRGQASTLIERQERALLEDEEEDTWDFHDTWETEFSDEDYNFSATVLSGQASDVLPSMFEGRIHRDEGRPVTLGELLMGLQAAGRLSEEQRLREQIAKERREAHERARAQFKGSLHVEDLEGDLCRTWNVLRDRTMGDSGMVNLGEIVELLKQQSLEKGYSDDEASAEAQVTALVSSLFLTHRGYVDLTQEPGKNGLISLQNLHQDDTDFLSLSERLNPKNELLGGVIADV